MNEISKVSKRVKSQSKIDFRILNRSTFTALKCLRCTVRSTLTWTVPRLQHRSK